MLFELSMNAGRVLTYERLLGRVWGQDHDEDLRPMRTTMSSLRRKLGDGAAEPRYIFTESRVGYRMPKGEAAAGRIGGSLVRRVRRRRGPLCTPRGGRPAAQAACFRRKAW